MTAVLVLVVYDVKGEIEFVRQVVDGVWKDTEEDIIYRTSVDFGLEGEKWTDWDGFERETQAKADTFSTEEAAAVVAEYELNNPPKPVYGFIIARGDEVDSAADDYTDKDD